VLCALRVLGGETTDGVLLTSSDGTVQKKLIVKADDNVRKHLQGYQEQQQQQNTDESDKEKYTQVQNYIQAMTGGQQPNAEDTLSRDLAVFKEKAAQQDRDDRRREERPARRGEAFVKGPTEYHSHASQQDMTTDEEIERRRREKHERDVENAYHQRMKRFEAREFQKMRDYKKDMKRELELEEREIKDKAYWMERLANWDDELEMTKGEEPYYVDRSRWRRMREMQRRREEERDEEDRRREMQEIEDEKARLEEEELRKKDSKFLNRENDDQKIAIKPTKLNFNLAIKRNTLGSAEDEEEEEAKKKRRVLVPLDYGDIKPEDEEQEDLTEEERARRVKDLIDSIPSSQTELWGYSVKWDVLTEVKKRDPYTILFLTQPCYRNSLKLSYTHLCLKRLLIYWVWKKMI
jgi:RNA-binding protein 25